MIDIVFPQDNESEFLSIAKKLGIKPLFAYEKEPIKEDCLGIYPGAKQANFLLAKASEQFRTQIEEWPVDGFFGVEVTGLALNQSIISLLSRKKKIVIFFLRNLFESVDQKRVRILEHMQILVPLCRKYSIPLVLATGATSAYHLRQMHDIAEFGALIGMTPSEIKKSFTVVNERYQYNEKKRRGEILSSGVIVEP